MRLLSAAALLGATLGSASQLPAQVPSRNGPSPTPTPGRAIHMSTARIVSGLWGRSATTLRTWNRRAASSSGYELEDGALPHNLIVDQKGWYGTPATATAISESSIPATGKITRYPCRNRFRDPHTLVFDHKGDIWFTVQQSNYVGRLRTGTRQIDVIRVAYSECSAVWNPGRLQRPPLVQ